MNIEKAHNGNNIILFLTGRLDTNTAHKLQGELMPALGDAEAVALDFAELSYLSSAGLRILLSGRKVAEKNGVKLTILNVSPEILEIFKMTGFTDILDIE